MKKLFYSAPILVLISGLLLACSSENSNSKLTGIFKPETIGVTIEWFEKQYGVAKNIFGDSRTYDIDGCPVSIRGEGSISAISLDQISEKCTFDLAPLIYANKPLSTYKLTFGKFESLVGDSGQYGADCLMSCGNAYDPSVWLVWGGSRAMNFQKIKLVVELSRNEAITASNQWEAVMIKEQGEDWVISGQFNDDHTYDYAARYAFANVPITSVSFGWWDSDY